MTDCRSFYLELKQSDFAETTEGAVDVTDIPFVEPANDNEPARAQLLGRGQALLRRLIANLREPP
jgi:hypothetical protein